MIIMPNVTPFRRPIRWDNLRADEAVAIVRTRAVQSGNVIFTEHAWERVDQRDITRNDIMMALRTGQCDGAPKKNDKGDWQVIVVKRLPGRREVGVVTVIIKDDEKLIVRTVQWMDL